MTTVTWLLGMERLCALAAEDGLSRFEVVEATLVHSVTLTDNAAFNEILRVKAIQLSEVVITDTMVKDVVSVEQYLSVLPYEVKGLLVEMQKLNMIHIKRAEANWEVLEAIIRNYDPVVAGVLAEADTGRRH